LKYRAEIDGLRALAVVPVILFHAGFELFSGGFVGVDVFFVISGYLITTILIDDIENKRFSIVNFYERRARRIMPALFFIVTLTLFFSLLYLPPHALKDVGESVVAVSFFLSNIFFYWEVDYFANTAELAPLLHTWSLAVEEQYYVLFPIFLILTWSFGKNKVFWMIVVMAAISLLLSEWGWRKDVQANFYLTPARAWEILAGSIAAFIVRENGVQKNDLLALLGLAAIIFSIFFYDENIPFPSVYALMPVIGVVLLVLYGGKETLAAKLLSIKVFVRVGLISYSLYLSHNIVFALSRNIGIGLSDITIKITLISVSIILALISFFLIEKPFRNIKASKFTYLIISAVLAILFAAVGFTLHKTDGLKVWKLSRLTANHAAQVIDAAAELAERRREETEFLARAAKPFDVNTPTRNVLILGDSKSADMYLSIMRTYEGDYYQFRRLYLDDTEMHGNLLNNSLNENLGAVISSTIFEQSDEIVLTATWQRATNSNVASFVEFLLNQGKKVSVVSTSNFNDVASLSYEIAQRQLSDEHVREYLFENIRQDWRRQYLELKETLQEQNMEVQFLDKLNVFCDLNLRTCNLRDSRGWYIYDSGHLTLNGADFFGRYILNNWFIEAN